jgi:hypothetical protein
MSEKLSFRTTNGAIISGRFEVKNGVVTVVSSDGRTTSAAIEESMLGPETLTKTLLLQLHQGEPEDE